MSTTHDLAKQLQETAKYLLKKPKIEIGDLPRTFLSFWSAKETFLALVRATVPGTKEVSDYNVYFRPRDVAITLSVDRSSVCRKVQDVKWECEPLLSPEEDAEMVTEK